MAEALATLVFGRALVAEKDDDEGTKAERNGNRGSAPYFSFEVETAATNQRIHGEM